MTKQAFLKCFVAMYRAGNMSDSDNENRESWTHPAMAGSACCGLLDVMSNQLVKCGVLTIEERDALYNNL